MGKYNFFEEVYHIVEKIPCGKVMSYGQIASILGSPHYARRVGQAMFNLPSGRDIPWYRVIKSSGELPDTVFKSEQKELLLFEGVRFKSESKVDGACFFHIL